MPTHLRMRTLPVAPVPGDTVCIQIDLSDVVRQLQKPLRPLWLTTESLIFTNEVPNLQELTFWPVVCLVASEPVDVARGEGFTYDSCDL